MADETIGVWLWHVHRDLVQADAGVSAYFGVEKAAGSAGVPLKSFLEGVHSEDRERVTRRITRAVVTGQPFDETYRVQSPRNGLPWVRAKGTCFRDKHGRPNCYPGSLIDVTGRATEDINSHILEAILDAQHLAEIAQQRNLADLLLGVLLEAGRLLTDAFDTGSDRSK